MVFSQCGDVPGAHVYAMRRDRSIVENAHGPQAHDRRLVVAAAGVIDVAAVFRHMHVKSRTQRCIGLHGPPQRAGH